MSRIVNQAMKHLNLVSVIDVDTLITISNVFLNLVFFLDIEGTLSYCFRLETN